jgi:phage baseplate assembly protein W
MIYSVSLNDKVDFAPRSEVEEVLQNIRTILSTRKGSVPLDRDFGVSWAHIDKPFQVAKTLQIAEIHEAIEKYEPRAKVLDVIFNQDTADAMEGILKPRVIVSIGEEKEEEDL